MQLLWLFFILSNLFYVFYFDENVFYFILFSVLFLPNFFNANFYTGKVSLFQYIQYLRTNLNHLVSFFELTKTAVKQHLLILFGKLSTSFHYYNTLGFISLFKFIAKSILILLEKKSLNQTLNVIDSFFLLFLKNTVNYFNISEKKNTIANIDISSNKTDIVSGQNLLNMINLKYKTVENKNVFSLKNLDEIFSFLKVSNKN